MALHIDHDAACIGQHGEVAHARNGPGQLLQHRPGRAQQVVVLLLAVAQRRGADGVKRHAPCGL